MDKYKVIEMSGREVAVRPIKDTDSMYRGLNLRKCPDCGQSATVIVTELGIIDTICQPRIWGYCGVCEVGG